MILIFKSIIYKTDVVVFVNTSVIPKGVVTCAIYCMQRAAIVACNNCRLSNVFETIHEAKVLQPMTAFGGIT